MTDERRTSLRFSRVKIDDTSAGGSQASKNGTTSSYKGKDDFDVFLYLNGNDQTSYTNLRDPALRRMTVSKYEGDVDKEGHFHGTGKMVSTLGYKYSGQFNKGLMHGKGKIEWGNGLSYDGTWEDNVISGTGRYVWPTGDTYDGQVKQSVRHGKGKFFYAALDETYTGDWVQGVRDGKGTLEYGGGSTYTGQWKHDKKCGTGSMSYGGKDTYEGEWLDDQRHGVGTMKWYNGNGVLVEAYAGNWATRVQHGQGHVTYIRPPFPFVPGSEGGLAAATGATGASGVFAPPGAAAGASAGAASAAAAAAAAAAKPVESLRPKDSAVNTYEGEFFMAKRHGFGTFIYDDGSRYEGMWEDNQKHGQGKFTSAAGVVTIGQFDRGTATTDLGVADPVTGATPPVPLYIRDILGVHENNVAESVAAVQSIVSRYNGLLKRVFAFYAMIDTVVLALPQPPKKERTQGTITVSQFLRMLTDAKLINRNVTIAVVDRILACFTDAVRPVAAVGVSPQDSVVVVGLGENASGENAKSMMIGGLVAEPSLASHHSIVSTRKASTRDASSSPHSVKSGSSVSLTPSSSPGLAGSTNTAALSSGGRLYARPWDQYRQALHMFTGELKFREFIEALVRVASTYYADDIWGPLATKVLVVLEDHLETLPLAPGTPILFPMTKENLATLQPHIPSLTQVFLHNAEQTSLGFRNAAGMHAASPQSPKSAAAAAEEVSRRTLPGVTIKFRQVALMLRAGGFFDHEKCTAVVLPKILRWDRFPANSTSIYNKRVILPATTCGLTSRPTSERCASAGDGGASERGSVAPSEGMRSSITSHTVQSHATTAFSTDKFERPVLSEAVLRSRWAMKERSKGLSNRNAHATLNMELELTFPEFVETLCEAANVKYAGLQWEQRVAALLKEVILKQLML